MTKAQEVFYATLGAGDFALEKARKAANYGEARKLYEDFVKRGRALTGSVRNAAPTKRAVAQNKAAKTQVKAATTSVAKAVRANTKATKSAASKTTKPS
jgi:hypothetical protein